VFVEDKYIHQISSRFRNFKKIKSGTYNFSCPICGDSTTNRKKARGYLFTYKNHYTYKCHNCGVSLSFDSFLFRIDSELHKEFKFELFQENNSSKNKKKESIETILKKKPKLKQSPLDDLELISNLDSGHIARQYVENRKIPTDDLYYCDGFRKWVNKYKKQFTELRYDDPRIVIPLRKENGELYGVQGRSLKQNSRIRYITVIFEEHPKVFGLNKIDKSKPVFIVEGPFDSLFLDNCIAMAGSDINVSELGINDYVFILDNEPRNQQICERIKKHIDKQEKVVVWPEEVQEKDINDMVLAGHSVQELVETYTCRGLTANLRFNKWKKIKLNKY
jgi:predicted RNA-binding Zn-ribbon protein involved in translation (DUF1610 family)